MLPSFLTTLTTVILTLGVAVEAQETTPVEGCMRLLGSVACPGFQYAYLSPSNLSNAFPFFSSVSDVRSFDAAALNYFSDPYQFRNTKFNTQLGCYNASTATIRYQRTVLCSMWVNEKWSTQCMAQYNGSAAATSQKMVCQSTCLEYSASEKALTEDQTYCPGEDYTNGNRSYQLNKDFVDCTNWTSLATNNTATCVSGDSSEGNCGYGTSTAQLCGFCQGSSPDDCCYAANTDVSVCGYSLPPKPSASSSASANPSATSGSLQDSHGALTSKSLSGGQIAGIVVGSVIGGLLLIALLVILVLFCIRRRRGKGRDSTSSFGAVSGGAGAAGLFAGLFSTRPHSNVSTPPHNSSEKGLLGQSSAAAHSSPTMGGDSTGGGHEPKNSLDSAAMLAGATTFGAMGMAAPGERSSGVVLPRVRDENQNEEKWIETGADVTVLWPYQATLPDELDLRPGMKLKVLRLYDDAWGTAQVTAGTEGSEVGKQGAFPIVCVSEGATSGSSPPSNTSH